MMPAFNLSGCLLSDLDNILDCSPRTPSCSPSVNPITPESIDPLGEMPPHSYQPRRARLTIEDSDDDEVMQDILRERSNTPPVKVDTEAAEGASDADDYMEEDWTPRRSKLNTMFSSPSRSTRTSRHLPMTPAQRQTQPPPTPHVVKPRVTIPSPRSRGSDQTDDQHDERATRSATIGREDELVGRHEEGDTSIGDVEAGPSTRSLRKRNINQVMPYKYDKHQHHLTTRTGKAADAELVEEAVQDEIETTQRRSARKKPRTSVGSTTCSSKTRSSKQGNKQRRRSTSAASSTTTEKVVIARPDLAKVTLRVWLENFQGAAIPTTLKECNTLEKLMDFITTSWGWNFSGASFHHAIISFPWLSQNANILLRPELKHTFEKMMDEVENAPVWTEKGEKATCEIKIVVYLKAPNAT